MKTPIIISISLAAILLALVLSWAVFVKTEPTTPVQPPIVKNGKNANTTPAPSVEPTPTPDDISILPPIPNDILEVEKNETAKNYQLDCTNKPDDFQTKYSWYVHFKKQIIENWSLDTVCYNNELNKVVYLKSKIDWENYIYDPSKSSYGLSRLGIYDIEKDKYDEAPTRDLGFYEGCGIIKEWKKNSEVIYQCGAGDAGIGTTNTFSYNTIAKTMRLIEKCEIQAGREPEKVCTKINF